MKIALKQTYMRVADEFAQLSYANKRKVGAVLVSPEGGTLAEGYNGTPEGWDNQCEDENGKTYPWVIHAEQNALDKVTRSTRSSVGAVLFTTTAPCLECAKRLLGAKVSKVYWRDIYKNTEGLEFLKKAGIETEQIG